MKISISSIKQFFGDLKCSIKAYFTDGKVMAGPAIAKSQIIDIVLSSALFLVPLPVHPMVGFPLRIAVSKLMIYSLDRYTFMKWPRGNKNALRAVIVTICFTAAMALAVYVLALELPVIITGAVLNLLLAFTC